MQLSKDGQAFIEGFEGYHAKLPDGGCKAYRTQIGGGMDDGKWTCGWGCTEGVTGETVWTRAQAEDAFARELSKFQAAVNKLVTVPINQNQFDSLVSFSYNVGIAGFGGSTLLKKLNAGDVAGAAAQFPHWNKSRGRIVPGLVRRRAAEAGLFSMAVEPSKTPDMPQSVDAPEASAGSLLPQIDMSTWSFARVNDMADQGSRLADHVRAFKNVFWGGAALSTAGAGSAAQFVDTTHGPGGAISLLASHHPFLLAGSCTAIVGIGAYLLVKFGIERGLVSAIKDGRYTPRGALPMAKPPPLPPPASAAHGPNPAERKAA
jgi:lysozyme